LILLTPTDGFVNKNKMNICECTVKIFTVCSYIQSLLIDKDLSECVTYQLSFHVLFYFVFHLETSSLFQEDFPLFIPILCYLYLDIFLFHPFP
jgi:hypothetical protein